RRGSARRRRARGSGDRSSSRRRGRRPRPRRTGRRWPRGSARPRRAWRPGPPRGGPATPPPRAGRGSSLVHQLLVVALLQRAVLLGDVALHALEQRASIFLGGPEL